MKVFFNCQVWEEYVKLLAKTKVDLDFVDIIVNAISIDNCIS